MYVCYYLETKDFHCSVKLYMYRILANAISAQNILYSIIYVITSDNLFHFYCINESIKKIAFNNLIQYQLQFC